MERTEVGLLTGAIRYRLYSRGEIDAPGVCRTRTYDVVRDTRRRRSTIVSTGIRYAVLKAPQSYADLDIEPVADQDTERRCARWKDIQGEFEVGDGALDPINAAWLRAQLDRAVDLIKQGEPLPFVLTCEACPDARAELRYGLSNLYFDTDIEGRDVYFASEGARLSLVIRGMHPITKVEVHINENLVEE